MTDRHRSAITGEFVSFSEAEWRAAYPDWEPPESVPLPRWPLVLVAAYLLVFVTASIATLAGLLWAP